MSTYVTDGSSVFTPLGVEGYESARATATVLHQILDRAHPDVTLRPAAMRTGTLRLVFSDTGALTQQELIIVGGYVLEAGAEAALDAEAASKACEDAHAAGTVFQLISSELGSIVMSYVADGSIGRRLDTRTDMWWLEVEFHEVVS